MQAATAAVLGAAVGAMTTTLGNALQVWKDDRRLNRQLRDQREARMLDRRITVHEEMLFSLNMAVTRALAVGPAEHNEFIQRVHQLLRTLEVISSTKVFEAAENATYGLDVIPQLDAFTKDFEIEVPASGLIDPDSITPPSAIEARRRIAIYRTLMRAEVGVEGG